MAMDWPGARGAQNRDDAVLLDELGRGGDRLRLVGGVVLDDDLDLLAVDAARVVDALDLELERVLLGRRRAQRTSPSATGSLRP